MQLILHYLKRYKKLFVLNIISVFGFALVELGIPTIVSEMIDNGIMNQDKQYLIRMGIVIAVISFDRCIRNDPAWILLCQNFHICNTGYQRRCISESTDILTQ